MKILFSVLVLVFAVFSAVQCQVYYLLVPVTNGSVAANHTYNNSMPAVQPIYNNNQTRNNTNYILPAYHGNNSGVYNGTQDGHLFVGTISAFDRLLFSQEIFKPSKWYTNREKIIEYPNDLPSGYTRHDTITAIRIYNRFYDGNSARAEILKGGIGNQYVKIKLYSKWGKGFNYLVQLYGR